MAVSTSRVDELAAAFNAGMVNSAVAFANESMDNGGANNYAMAQGRLDFELQRLNELGDRGQDVQADVARISACYNRLKDLQAGIPIVMTGHKAESFRVRFIVNYGAGSGDIIELRGAEKASLSWQSGKALIYNGQGQWEIDLILPSSVSSFEYKVVLRKNSGEVLWEEIPTNGNRFIEEGSGWRQVITPVFKA